MANPSTKTIKINQTIRLDIDFSQVESVRIVDVDLLILLKDGQRLIIPEGAVRAMMDNDFAIFFKNRQVNVAQLMELQTFESKRVTEVGIAQKPALPEKPPVDAAADVNRLDLKSSEAKDAPKEPVDRQDTIEAREAQPFATQPAQANTEANALSRQEALALDQRSESAQAVTSENALASAAPTSARSSSSTEIVSTSANRKETSLPDTTTPAEAAALDPGMSSLWKYAVGALGAGLSAVATRLGSKSVVEAVAAVNPTNAAAFSDYLSISGTVALGPLVASKVNMQVLGRDANGKVIRLSGLLDTKVPDDAYDLTKGITQVSVQASGKYDLRLNVKSYTGPVVVVLSDANGIGTPDYKDEATQKELSLGDLMLRASNVINGTNVPTFNITPLTELAVRTALGPEKSAKTQEVPIDSTTVNKANVAIAQAFGLGTGENVASSPLKTVLDTGYKVDGTVESNYALALAALSGVDSKQTGTTTAEKVNQTLSGIEKTFTTTNPLTNNSLSVPALQQLMSGALQVQPVVVQQTGDTTLNLTDKLAAQLTNSVGVKSVVTVVLSSASDVLGPAGQIVKFNFNQSVSSFGIQHIQLSPSNYTLSQLKRVDDLGTVWSALITPAPGVNESVSVSVSSSVAASSTTWSWTVDTQAPTAPTVSLGVTAANVVSDSGKFANDGISNVKTPRVRVDLSADAAVGDVITLTQVDKTSQRPILDTSTGLARNQKVVALTLADITNRFILLDLQDLGADGAYQLKVVQQDAAGNAAPAAVIDYTLLTTPPGAPAVNLVAGQVDLGLDVTGLVGKTPPGLVNALAKNAGITFSGTGGAQGADITVTWGTITKKLQADSKGSWTVRFASNEVPADSPATVLSVSQTDVAGNRSAVSAYTVEVATAGVSAKVLSMGVEDDSGAVSLGAYSVNAQGTVPSGQSTDDSTPVVTIRLDRNLQTNEVIELYDGPITANAKPVLTLSGTAVAVENGLFIWRATTSSWAQANTALKAGAHQLSARVINTHTWDVGTEVDAANRATLSVQSLNFNQLLLNDDPATNQIPANQSAGAVVLNGVAVNKPVLGGTLQTALASGERLAVYDTVSGVDKLLGTATLVAVKDSNNVPTGTYTWRFTPPTGLSNGLHSLSVRLETDSATPVVRLAMSQDITVTIPVLSIAPASASPNGLSTDTGISSTDGISSSKTPYLRLLFPSVGRQVGDIVTVVDVADNNKVVATQSLTAEHLAAGQIDFPTNTLGATGITKTLNLVARISAAPGGVQLPDSAPLPYVLDTLKPDAPSVSLVTDTSNGKNITQIPLLKPIAYDANELRLEYQIKKNGSIIQAFSERVPQLLTDGSQDGTYSIAARLVDKAGNVSQVDISTALGTGTGYVNFVLDTLRPATLSAPSLKEDTTNGLTGFARDNITSNFRLADEQPTIESGAQLQYKVQGAGQTTDWLPTYLDAMGAANRLSGAALTNWKNLSSATDQAALLAEGLYSVTRRQIDTAGNISLESSTLSFTLDTQITQLVVALENDTSKGKSVSSDVRIKLSGVEGTPGVEAKVVYELTRYTDANRTTQAAEGTVTTTNTYTPPTKEGFYILKVTQTNKAGLSNASELKFQLDSTASPAPDALQIEDSSDSKRGTSENDKVGAGDGRSNVTVPTFNVKLATVSNAPQVGDRLELYRDGDLTKPWGVKVLDSTDLAANVVKISANTLAPADGQPIGSTDGVYTFKARWVDVAGNASAMSPALTYTLDTVAQAPTIQPIQLEGLPQNLINRQDKVVFSGTGEAGAMLTLRWDNLTYSVEVSSAGTWRLELQRTDDPTTSQFPADTARLGFTSNVTVTLIDPAGNASASSTLMLALNTATVQTLATVTSVTDSNRMGSGLASVSAPGYSVNPTGEVAKGATTDEHLPIITGTLNQALPDALRADGSDCPTVRVYDGNVLLGLATVTGTQWTFAVTTPLANGVHNFSADVYDPLTLQTGARGSAYGISSNMLTLQPLDAAHPAEWIIQNTATPTLGGELKAALATGESLVVYDRQSDGSFTRLGVVSSFNTTANGVTWSFDMPRPMFGAHVYRVQVENAAGVGLMALDQSVRYDFNSVLLKAGSDTGLSPDDGISNIKTPTVQVRFASQTQVGAVVKILLDGQPLTGAAYQRAVTAADLSAGVMEFTLPDLWARTGNAGLPLKDRTTRISATVGDLSVVSDVYYQLDTLAPTLEPSVAVQTLTGGSTGYTSNKTLTDLTKNLATDSQAYVQVQVVDTATSNVLRDWVSLESFNAAPLADSNYTLRNRMVDKAGNIGAKLGTELNLRYDTQAAQVLSVQAVSSADTTVAYQQDAYLNKFETAASATFQFKLTFNEKIKGLTKELLSLKTSLGAGALAPTLDSVSAVSADAQGFTAEWLVTVSQLDRMSEDSTLQLILNNGTGLLDQAGNAGTLAYSASPVMRVDRIASLNLTDLLSGTRSLLSGDSSLVLFNGAAVSTGVMVKGKVLGVEAGRLVTVTIKDDKGASIYTTDGAAVAADGTWSINLTPGTQALGLLQDKGNYTLTASVTDQAGNLAQATLNVAARLTASIDINTVLASSSGQTVLSYATSSLDDAVTADDKTAGVSGGAQGGFSVRGVTSLEAGRVVTVALMQVGSSVQVLGSGGVVAANGAWEVRFTSTQVGNLTDGRWVLVASGQDASGNEARNDERSRIFTVDTRATVNMNVVSDDARINLSQDGATLAVSGSFTDIESDRTLTLKLRDRNADDPSKVVWESTGVTLGSNGQWATNITLALWDALSLGKDANGVSLLMLTASATDKAGNLAEYTTSISLDRSPPAVPNVGDAVRQIAGDTLTNASTQSQSRSLTLADTSTGVRLAPNAVGPTVTDVVTIVVEGTSVQSAADQWRLGGTLVGMNASTPETAATLGTGSDTIAFTYAFDANTRQLSIKAVGGAFSPTQVQALLRDLSWVNTQSDVALSQVDRVFKVRYVDAFQNLSDQANITFQVDTLKPTTLSDITLIPAGGTVTANTLNATNTGMGLKATIGAGQATGGKAEFYINGVLIGTDDLIEAGDTQVNYQTDTKTAIALQAMIASGGVVSVMLYDQAGNHLDANGPTLVRDLIQPKLTGVALTATRDGSVMASGASLKSGDVVTVTAFYDEVVVGNLINQPVLQIGTETNVTLTPVINSGDTRSWTYTINAGRTDTGPITISSMDAFLRGVTDSAGNDASGMVDPTGVYTADTTAPRLTISDNKATGAANSTVTYTFTFSEDVMGFDPDDVTVTNGSKGAFAKVDSKTYTLVVTPTANSEGADIGVHVGTGLTDIATNAIASVTDAPAQSYDTKAPTLTITDNKTTGAANSTVTYTFTFSEDVTGFDADDVTVANGSKGTFTKVDNKTYTLAVAPTANAEGADIGVRVGTGLTDMATNAIAAATDAPAQSYDTKAPMLTITDDKDIGAAISAVTYTFTFSEDVMGFDADDVTVNNGSKGAFTKVDNKTYTLVVTPTANAEGADIGVRVGTGLTDMAANAIAVATDAPAQSYDTKAPTIVSFNATTANGSYKAGTTIELTATSSEALQADAQVTVTLDTGETVVLTRDSTNATLFKGNYSVGAGRASADLTVSSYTLGTGSAAPKDVAGNAMISTTVPAGNNIADAKNIVIDTTAPTIVSFNATTANGSYKAGTTIELTATSSEALQADAQITVTLDTGETVVLTRDTTNATLFKGNYSVGAGRASADLTVSSYTLGTGSAAPKDVAGNAMISTTVPAGNNIADAKDIVIDTTAPTLSITNNKATGAANSPVTYTFTFNEDVTGFNADDVSVANGSKGAFTKVDNKTYTLVVTPTANAEGADIGVRVGTGLTDMATNAIAVATDAPAQSYDTKAPTIVSFNATTANGSYQVGTTIELIAISSEALQAGAQLTVTLDTGETVVLTRDTAAATLFKGTYTVIAGNNSADLTVSSYTLGTGSAEPKDVAGNAMTSTTVPTGNNIADAKNIVIDTTAPSAIDLIAGDVVNATESQFYNAANAGNNKAIAPSMGRSTDADLAKIKVTIGGANAANDKLILSSTVINLGAEDQGKSKGSPSVDVTVDSGSVSVDWEYSGVDKVLTLSKRGGGILSAPEVQAIERALNFKTISSDATQGNRTFKFEHVDLAGNTGTAIATETVMVDTIAAAVDLDIGRGGIQTATTVSVNSTGASAGAALFPTADKPAASDTRKITLVLGGTNLDTNNDKLVLDNTVVSLTANITAATSGVGVSINSISGLTYSYDSGNKKLEILRVNGEALSNTDVKAVLGGIKYQNTTSPTGTDRTATVSYTDMADNTGGPSVVTWTVDTVAPTVRSIGMSSTGRQNNFVNTDDDVLISVKFSEAVNYTAGSGAAPTLNLNIGSTPVSATYASGSGSDTLVFTYKILSGQSDGNGISIPATGGSPIVINSGAIRDLAGNDATLTFSSLGDDATLKVDTAVPTITGVTVTGTDSSGTAKTGPLTVGDKINVTINTSESVIVSGSTSVSINVGTTVVGGYSASRTATYVAGSGTSSLVYTYEIQAGDTAAAGAVTATTTPLTLTGAASVTDLAGNLITNTVASTPTLAVSTSVSTAGVPNARVTSASLSADTAPATSLDITSDTGLATDFITRTAAQTITGSLTGTAANGDKVQISLNNGSTWTDLATYNSSTSSWTNSAAGSVTISGSTTTYSYAATLSGANTLQARVLSSGGVASSAWRQAYVLDTSLVNTFNPGLVITTSPVFSGIADPGAYIKLELDTNASITGSGASATGYELTYLTQANNLGYWSVNTASLAPVSGTFTPLTATPSGGSNTNIRVTAADKAGNSSVVTASAPVVNTTYALSNANVIEGTSGTRTLAFLVTRAGDLTSSSTVNYAVDIANSSAVQGVAAPTLTNGDFSGSGGWTYATSGAGPAPSIVSAALNFANTGANQGGYATQDVTLNAGQRYTVSWDQTGSSSIAFGVSDSGGAVLLADQSVSGAGSKSFSFTALSTGTASLKFTDNSTTTVAVTVDNVSLTSPGSSFDYTGTSSGTVWFDAGETTKLISFSVTGDYYKEINDNLTLTLSNPSGGGSVVKNFGVGVIQEVDATRMRAIYSLEDVNPNLVTFAVKVRRESDSATMDIGFDAYGQLDKAALLKFASNNGALSGASVKAYVDTWYDQSGNARDLVQPNTASQGVIVNNGAVITRADGSYGISFNNGLNGSYSPTVVLPSGFTSSTNTMDYMYTTNGLAGTDWTDVVLSTKVQSTGTQNGSLFQLGTDDTHRLSSHYISGQQLVWDVGTTSTSTGRLRGGTVTQGVTNDMVYEAHTKITSAGTAANNYVDATQSIFMDGVRSASDNNLDSSGITTGSTWYLAAHYTPWNNGGTLNYSDYYENAIYSEFSVFLDNTSASGSYATPTVQVLKGSAENDVLTYSGESVTTIDGGAGYDVLYLQGATNLTPALLTNGMANIEQIWAQNGSANTISLTDADLLKNPAPLLINMDAGDRVILNGTSYDYSDVDTQSLMVDTTGDDTLIATGANDHFLDRGGSNTYVWLPNQTGTDRIDGFSQTRDKLDISKLLQGYSSGNIANYVTVSTNGYDTTVRVDLDGSSGSLNNIQTIILKDVAINSTAEQLLTAGALKVL